MLALRPASLIERLPRLAPRRKAAPDETSWSLLPRRAQIYVAAVVVGGTAALMAQFPFALPRPVEFILVVVTACLTAAWKVNLLLPLRSGSTLSVSSAPKFMALLLLGAQPAVMVAVAAALTQCTYKVKQAYPLYRTIFSVTAEALTMAATGLVYVWLGGATGPLDVLSIAKPLVGAIATYFVVNTGLIAAAIALSTGRGVADVWWNDFLWSGVTFMVAGTAGAFAAVVVSRGEHWAAVLLVAPLYLTYRAYRVVLDRFLDQQRHMTDIARMHEQTVAALGQAHDAERALADEKNRLAVALVQMTRLEEQEHHLLEREQAARASAEEANRVKDQFLAIVSHELRTPLNAILGWADMLRMGALDRPSRGRAIQTIFDSANRQAQLIDDLLDVARIMSRKLTLQRTFVDVEEVVRAAVQALQPIAVERQLQVAIDAEACIGVVYGDRARLQQVVWNLLSNAMKFTDAGGSIGLRLRRKDDRVELVVSDTGRGISPEFLPFVFEPFRQADGTTTRAQGGLGLGLSIVKHLVEAHGGIITASSEGERRGAAFTVTLPRAALSANPPDIAAAAALDGRDVALTSLDGISVLVVDDDDDSREVVTVQLRTAGARVVSAASAAEALDRLQHERVDVLLADIAMPGEDGHGLIRKVRTMPAPTATIPAAAVTAFTRREDRQRALESGFQLHIAKPVDAQALVEAVATLAGSRPLS
jgi:signal transduction histidine kinase/ActR/RegA family two-component response regulator